MLTLSFVNTSLYLLTLLGDLQGKTSIPHNFFVSSYICNLMVGENKVLLFNFFLKKSPNENYIFMIRKN